MNMEKLQEEAGHLAEVEMRLFQKKEYLQSLVAQGNTNQHIFNMLDDVDASQKVTEELMEANRIKRNELNQARLMNSFQIIGLEDDAVENTDDLAEILSQALHVPIDANIIRGFETIDGFKIQRQAPISQPAKITVVHMVSRDHRNHILQLAGSAPLPLVGAEEPLLIQEHLTFMNTQILRFTLQEAVRLGLGPVWVEDGKIFVRKTETSEPVQIGCEADIKDMQHM